jgi:hypothetical protein
MPAVSKAQQRFMGMVHAAQKGDMENPSPEVQKAADSMSDKDAKDYASTSHKGLPDKKENMITKNRLKEIVKEVMVEEAEYQAFFKKALEKAGKGINDMSDDEKKAFFDKVDSAWNGKGEKNEDLTGGQHKLDVDKDGDIEGDDLADLRAGKKVDESTTTSAPGAWVAYLSMTRGKKLLKTFDTARGAKQFLSKNVDKLLGGANVESVGIMTKKQWDEREAKYAVESVDEAVDVKAGGYRLVSKPNEGIKLYYGGKVIATGFYDSDDWYFWMKHSNWKGSDKGFNNPKEIINYFRAKKITTENIATELPKATIPSSVKQKLDIAIDKIKDSKLNPTQKLQLVAQVIDSLGIDKSQLGTITTKIRSKMESVNEDFSKGELVWFNRGQNERGMTISTPVVGRLSKIVGSKNVEIQVISPSNSKGDIFTTDKNSLKIFPQKGKKVRMDVVMDGGQGSGSQSFDEIEGVVVSADPNTKQIVIKNKEGKNVKLHLYNILKIK